MGRREEDEETRWVSDALSFKLTRQTPAAAASLHDVEQSRTRSCKRLCSSSAVSRGELVLRYRDPRGVLFSSWETIVTP